MFERFTETAKRTLFFARHETTELGGMAIDPEHVLLGLLRADKGPAPHLFAIANLSYSDARVKIRTHWGVRQQVHASVEIPFSDQTEHILKYATEEADRLGHKYIGTGHLLLGLLREDSSFAAAVLRTHGMTLEGLREHMVKPPAVPEPEPEAPAEGGAVWVKHEAFEPIASLELIRWLAEDLGRSQPDADDTHSLMDEIHRQLDALKRHLTH